MKNKNGETAFAIVFKEIKLLGGPSYELTIVWHFFFLNIYVSL